MRLVSAHIRGFGRLVDTKINLDTKVIAVVGPNEAGKSTLLRALAYIDQKTDVPLSQRSRAVDVSDETAVVTVRFALDQGDAEALTDLGLSHPPVSAEFVRHASGKLDINLDPAPRKSVAGVQLAGVHLSEALASSQLESWVKDSVYSDDFSDAARNYRGELAEVRDAVVSAIAEQASSIDAEHLEQAKALLSATEADEAGAIQLCRAFEEIVAWAEREDPAGEAKTRIWRASPSFLLFEEADRSLQSTYTFDEELVKDTPPALSHLAGTAGLDLGELWRMVETGQVARRRTAIVQANARMDAIFADAWKQSRLSVHFELDGFELRIELMEDGGQITIFNERSAGLRMFVALVAFLKTRTEGSARPPVLLIDEAETHLHLDAQADLVSMFVAQRHAAKVIYTTHSPACLPPDLGTGIRTVVPSAQDAQTSVVKNSFWQGAAGFSPLMLAMGAAAAAFTPARRVVLAEGATEMILLPTLLRAATKESDLPYQIAPGLSETHSDFLSSLDLEAARVAYLVDTDKGGESLAADLVRAGVPERLITDLGTPGIENLLDPGAYQRALSALLIECNPSAPPAELTMPIAALGIDQSWAKWATTWIEEQGLRPPSKVAVANWLVQNNEATPSSIGTTLLAALHDRLLDALGRDHL